MHTNIKIGDLLICRIKQGLFEVTSLKGINKGEITIRCIYSSELFSVHPEDYELYTERYALK